MKIQSDSDSESESEISKSKIISSCEKILDSEKIINTESENISNSNSESKNSSNSESENISDLSFSGEDSLKSGIYNMSIKNRKKIQKINQKKIQKLNKKLSRKKVQKPPKKVKKKKYQKKVKKRCKKIPNKKQICSICLEALNPSEFLTLRRCYHKFCLPCLNKNLETKLKSKMYNIICPSLNCRNFITDQLAFLIPENIAYKRNLQNFIKKNLSYPYTNKKCPNCKENCFSEKNKEYFFCGNCYNFFCQKCERFDHDGECLDFNEDECDKRFGDLTEERFLKKCKICGFWIEKVNGCNSVRCRCGNVMCYKCGKRNCVCYKNR